GSASETPSLHDALPISRGDPRAEGHDQHHGGSAELLRLGGDARGARGGNGGTAGGSGGREGRGRHLEGPHRRRELDGRKSHGPDAEHRRGDEGGGGWGSLEEDHGGRARG